MALPEETMEITEHITIRNFFTVKEFDWEIKEFNVLIGGMGTGKSVCVKLLCFFERVLNNTIFFIPFGKTELTEDEIFRQISKLFLQTFLCDSYNFNETELKYEYSSNDMVFDLHTHLDKEAHSLCMVERLYQQAY
jgi:ABC-type transporter Mla maintaining outer membrane lipid asymmetry ATPase subunit MlaF